MSLEVSRLALETIASLRPLVPRIRRHDRSLAVQLVRAASSTVLNLGEGEYSDPGTKRARYCNAAGSANARAYGAGRRRGLGLPHRGAGRGRQSPARSGHRHAVQAHPPVTQAAAGQTRTTVPVHMERRERRGRRRSRDTLRSTPKWDRLRLAQPVRTTRTAQRARGVRSMAELARRCKEVAMPEARMQRRLAGMLATRLDEAHFDQVRDDRGTRGRRWHLETLLVAVLTAMAAGARTAWPKPNGSRSRCRERHAAGSGSNGAFPTPPCAMPCARCSPGSWFPVCTR